MTERAVTDREQEIRDRHDYASKSAKEYDYWAVVNFAASWLFARTSMMNAANRARDRNGYAPAYGDESYAYAIEDAEKIARGEEIASSAREEKSS